MLESRERRKEKGPWLRQGTVAERTLWGLSLTGFLLPRTLFPSVLSALFVLLLQSCFLRPSSVALSLRFILMRMVVMDVCCSACQLLFRLSQPSHFFILVILTDNTLVCQTDTVLGTGAGGVNKADISPNLLFSQT